MVLLRFGGALVSRNVQFLFVLESVAGLPLQGSLNSTEMGKRLTVTAVNLLHSTLPSL